MSANIRTARRDAGLSQVALAERVGVTQQAVQKWESGASVPTGERLRDLASVLECSVDFLLTGSFPRGQVIRPGDDDDPPPTSPAGALDPSLVGIAARAGRLTPGGRAKLEAYLDGLLDAEEAEG